LKAGAAGCLAVCCLSPLEHNTHNQAGDVLILTKPLGVGVMTTALKKGLLPPEGYEEVR
jgi:selenide,water dikinase